MNADSGILSIRKTFRQLFSYALIGILTNVLGYAFYLLLTYLWDAPKITMTALYFVGASIGFSPIDVILFDMTDILALPVSVTCWRKLQAIC